MAQLGNALPAPLDERRETPVTVLDNDTLCHAVVIKVKSTNDLDLFPRTSLDQSRVPRRLDELGIARQKHGTIYGVSHQAPCFRGFDKGMTRRHGEC